MPEGIRQPEFRGNPEAREANRLYWDTDESVNGIAERLEMSKGRLYDAISPLPAEATCPECGGPLGYANRTARDGGIVACPLCSFEAHRDEVEAAGDPGRHPAVGPVGRSAAGGSDSSFADGTLVGVALVGVAVGLVLGRWLRS